MMKYIKSCYKMFQVRMIRFLTLIWSKEFQLQEFDKVLILSPHPDDEVIGCAGLIQKLLKQQKEVYVLMITGGGAAWSQSLIDTNELIAKRKELMFAAAGIIGLPHEHYIQLGWTDGELMDIVNKPEKQLEFVRIIESIKPYMILTPHPFEIIDDHNAVNVILNHSMKISNHKMKVFYYWVHAVRPLRGLILGWTRSFIVSLDKEEHQIKRRALDTYLKLLTPFNKPYSGELYKSLLFSMKWNKELFFDANFNSKV